MKIIESSKDNNGPYIILIPDDGQQRIPCEWGRCPFDSSATPFPCDQCPAFHVDRLMTYEQAKKWWERQ